MGPHWNKTAYPVEPGRLLRKKQIREGLLLERRRLLSTVLNILLFTLLLKGIVHLSAALAKSSPLDFPSEESFLLFFAHEKGLGHVSKIV